MSSCSFLGPRFVGDPVDVITGEVRDIATDLRLTGERTFVFERYYQSFRAATENRGIGAGHRHSLDWWLRVTVDGFRLETPQDPVFFAHLWTDGERVHRDGWTLVRRDALTLLLHRTGEPTREFTRLSPDHRILRLARLLDKNGGSVVVHYRSTQGFEIQSVRDTQGWVLSFEWAGGLLRAIRASGSFGQFVPIRYHYDERGFLMEGTDAYQHTFRWNYDNSGRVLRRTDRRGYSFLYRYDARGRCIRAAGEDDVDATVLTYDPDAHQTTVVHETNGATWQYRYGLQQNLLEIEDPYGGTRGFIHDPDTGQLVAQTDGNGELWTVETDDTGLRFGLRDPLGYWHPGSEDPTRPQHDPLQRRQSLVPLTQELGHEPDKAMYVPDEARLKLALALEVADGLMPGAFVGNEREVRNAAGLLLHTDHVYPDGRTESRRYVYDATGNLLRDRSYDGGQVEYTVASWNQRTSRKDALGHTTQYRYDKRDQLVALQDPNGTLTRLEWDLCGRLAAVHRHGKVRERYIRDLGGHLVEKRDALDRILVQYERGPAGALSRRSGPGFEERFERDKQGRVTTATRTTTHGTQTVECAHDALGRRRMDLRGGVGVVHAFGWQGRSITTFLASASNEDTPGHSYSISVRWTARDRVEITDPTSHTHQIESILPGIFRRTHPHHISETAQYDPRGRCLAKVTQTPQETWRRRYLYSAEGRLLRREDDRISGVTTYFEYDRNGQLLSIRHPSGQRDEYQYDAAGNLLSKPGLREGSTHDGPSLHNRDHVALTSGNQLYRANGHRFYYDKRDHIKTRETAGGKIHYHRDALGLLWAVSWEPTGGPSKIYWAAEYDALGRRVEKRWYESGKLKTQTFYWDTERLVAEVLPGGTFRLYLYAHSKALVPILAVEYEHLGAAPNTGRVLLMLADHRGAVERVQDLDGVVLWDASIGPYGEATIRVGKSFHQPFRLVGQYYDRELGLCAHRYRNWSPELGRFLESDPSGADGGLNLYAWPGCPLNLSDPWGLGCPEQQNEQAPTDQATDPNGPEQEGPGQPKKQSSDDADSSVVDNILADFDDDTRSTAKKSPSLVEQLTQLDAQGIAIEKGKPGTGSFYDAKGGKISIDGNIHGAQATGVIAHEVGHATYKKEPEYLPTVPKEDYVKENVRIHMEDEGNAQFNAAKARSEALANGGNDPGIPGHQEKYQDVYDRFDRGEISEAEAKKQMADHMGNEVTSTTGENYNDYYGDYYRQKYDWLKSNPGQ